MVNIKVAVRIKPLTEREISNGEEIIVRKENNSVFVTIPKIPGRQDLDTRPQTKKFVVDYCYDPSWDQTSTQKAVYEDIGSRVLDSMFEGYNACVLAYGHSASGKTYTIMGAEDDPGLTPRICRGLFQKLENRGPSTGLRIRVVVSFLEIYNEKVRDLLGDDEANFSLRVREHPKLGPYVQGLKEHLAMDEGKLLELLATGSERRITATTENNARSSRSHAVFSLRVVQSDNGESYETEKSSKVHLVDLAGSERAGTSLSKTRLKEGANINKSLATLGNVISALADACEWESSAGGERSGTRPWQPFVPYRDSVLTWLLKDTLGGNSNTVMIATISSASGSVGETLNTLRYAKRTKRIVNRPIVNEDPKVRTIRELREEILRLKRLLFALRPDERDLYPETRWPDTGGGTNAVVKEEKEMTPGWRRVDGEGEEKKGGREGDMGVVPWEGDACETSREKKSDGNVSVNDNFSHETQTFSDSLESFAEARNSHLSADNRNPSETHGKKTRPGMLHRSRPDLIRGISTRSKESLKSGSGQSSVDASNLSQSTSENSLNSSGSVEAQPSERSTSPETGDGDTEAKTFGRKEKKPEAGPTRTKNRELGTGKKHSEEEQQRKEAKLCKRARMKLFDLSRKLALAKIGTKTVDTDTQTDHVTGVIRVKEKSVATDFDKSAPEKDARVIMNQVFVPGTSNYVLEYGNMLRIEAPTVFDRRETATQTGRSPEDESFSEDSLDLEDKSKCDEEKNEKESFSEEPKQPRPRFLMEMYLDGDCYLEEDKDGNISSENSFTSNEGTNPSCGSETSSEDFEFFENPDRGRGKTKRELYTITENSEQSDASEAFSPVQSRGSVADGEASGNCQGEREKVNANERKPERGSTKGKDEKKCSRDEKPANRLSNSKTQYLNLNISGRSSLSPFTVDTHLFEKNPRDESAETLFNSVDSITFYFMGPAKPETSVLMEVIRRSFGRGVRGKSKNKGVQCNVGLPRSVSVDTAMMALARIAKNQETLSRTFSLANLTPGEDSGPSEKGQRQGKREESDVRKSVLKCFAPEDTEQEKMKTTEKCKKTVTWSGEPNKPSGESLETPTERRVRFYNPESEEDGRRREDDLTALLKEATQLLKSVNAKKSEVEAIEKKDGRGGNEDTMRRSRTESCLEKEDGENKWKQNAWEQREVESNATWPRRRALFGKPPSGAKPKTLCPSRSDSLQSRARSQSPRTVSSARSWDLSSLSVSLCRFCGSENGSDSPPLPRRHGADTEQQFLRELEKDLEESCRRLEAAVEEDERREKRSERVSWEEWQREEKRAAVKRRRKRGECGGECGGCDSSSREKCREFRSRGPGSSFELDSFGPGAKHCPESCMFCRGREAEAYSSALNLNSDCSLGLCRLSSYGYCPCSTARLKRVVTSPRAYMHHLLTQRRLIVGQSRRSEGGGHNLPGKWRTEVSRQRFLF